MIQEHQNTPQEEWDSKLIVFINAIISFLKFNGEYSHNLRVHFIQFKTMMRIALFILKLCLSPVY